MKLINTCLIISLLSISPAALSQNLVVNPGAELLPAGTGWTVADRYTKIVRAVGVI